MIDSRFRVRSFGLVLLLGSASLAAAQKSPSELVFPSVKFDSVGVKEVVEKLFQQVRKKYPKATFVLEPGTMGAVTINRKGASLDTVLQEIARQIDAGWKIDEGYVYRIAPRFAPRALPNVQQYRDEIKGRLQAISALPTDPATPRPPLDPELRVTLLNELELNKIKARAAVLATNHYRVTSVVVKELIDFRPDLITVDVVVTYAKSAPKTKPLVYKDRWQLRETGGWMLLWRREYVP